MIFKKISIKNIRSYKEFEMEFPEGSMLLSGDIGAGKTSILLALQFALFGLQPGQKGSSLLRQGEDNAEVKLELEMDGKIVVIERTIKKGKNNAMTQDFNAITVDNQREELSTSEMKNKVITLLDYPHEFTKKSDLLYRFTVYTPQEGMKEIIEEKAEVRLNILRHIFGIDRYRRIKDNSLLLIQKLKENVKFKEIEIKDIPTLREKLAVTNEDKIKCSKESNDLSFIVLQKEQERTNAKIELDKTKLILEEKNKLDSEFSKKEAELSGKKALRMRFEKELAVMLAQLGEKIEFDKQNLDNVSLLLQKHKNLLEELNLNLMNISSKISVLNSNKETSAKLKQKVISIDNCPTCFQSVTCDHKEKISKKTQYDIEEIDRELVSKLEEREKVIKAIESEKRLILGYEQDKLSLEKNKIKFEHQRMIDTKIKSDTISFDRILSEITQLESGIKELRARIAQYSEMKTLFDSLQINYEKISFETKRIEISYAEKRKETEMLKQKIEDLSVSIAEKEKIRVNMLYLREIQDWLEEKFLPMIDLTESNVMIKLRKEFSKVFSEWFSLLVSDSLSVRLDEDFSPIITNQDYEIDYEFLSGGERTAVALAYRLALNQIINSLLSKIKTRDILILDEPTDGFSEQQLNKMRDIFDQIESKQIILVSHEQKIEGFVDNVIRIKKDGTSLIEAR